MDEQPRSRIVIVTGGAAGIGRATCLAFAERGDTVIAVDCDAEGLARLCAEAPASGSIEAQRLDLREVATIPAGIAEIVDRHGRVDVLVNNAGVTKMLTFFEVTPDDWDWMHDVNSRGAFFCMQEVAHQMVERGEGSIVNIASVGGKAFRGTTNVAYAASKGAMLNFTRTAASALAADNVRVNAICPGVVLTEIRERVIDDIASRRGIDRAAAIDLQTASIPLGRPSTPEDVAEAVLFLASPQADTITGQLLGVDGGLV